MAKRLKRVTHGERRGIRKALGTITANQTVTAREATIIDLTLTANRTLTISDIADGDRLIVKATSTCCGTLTINVKGDAAAAAVIDVYDANAGAATGFTVCDINYVIIDVIDAANSIAIAEFLID